MTDTYIAPLSHSVGGWLIDIARTAASNAYVPYSNFRVGAAVLSAHGTTVAGCNIENASYGLVCCAERVAMFAALAQGHRQLVALAVTCPDGDPNFPSTLMPCGACRQVMAELLDPGAVIIVDRVGRFRIDDLLPLPFTFRPGNSTG